MITLTQTGLYNTFIGNNIVLLRDVFHIGLAIGPIPAVLVWGEAKANTSDRGPITRPIWKTSRNDTFIN